MVVRLDLEGDGHAVADVNDAGVFLARAHENLGRLGGEGFEQRTRVLVAAMFAPHHGENAELGIARQAAAEDDLGIGKFFGGEVVFGNQFGGDGGFAHVKILVYVFAQNPVGQRRPGSFAVNVKNKRV